MTHGSLGIDLFIEIFTRAMAVLWYTTAEVLRKPISCSKENDQQVIIVKVSKELAGNSPVREKLRACQLKYGTWHTCLMPEAISNAQNVVPDDIEPDLGFEGVLESIADDVLVGADGKLICTEEQ